MKHASVFVAAALLVIPALAPHAGAAEAGTMFLPAQTANQYLAKDHLIGAKVYGKDGKIIADVEDLIVNEQNQVIGVVMGTGGYFGIAEKKIGIDLSSLKFEEKDGHVTVSVPDVTQEVLNTAPTFQRAKPPKSLFDRAKEKVHELTDKTTSSTAGAIEQAKPALEEAKKQAEEALQKAKEAATPAIEKAKEAVSGAIDEAKKAVGAETAPAPEATPAPSQAAPATPPEAAPAPAPTPAPAPAQ
ncbi:MAG: PRC-barrel domain-containing protein [Hyphomicrobium sp.]|jgi:sporulation protein YlmC with PRC-barrel domain